MHRVTLIWGEESSENGNFFKENDPKPFLTLKMKKYLYVFPMLIHISSMKWDLSIFEYNYYIVVYLYDTPSYCYTSKIHR